MEKMLPLDSCDRPLRPGLTLAHSRAHLFRAVLESVAYGIGHNIDTFQSIGAQVNRILSVGGGTKSRSWLQIVSDVAGIPQEVPELTIGASFGDAFLAGQAAGILHSADLRTWIRPGITIQPDPGRKDLDDFLFVDYRALYKNTCTIVHRLSNLANQVTFL